MAVLVAMAYGILGSLWIFFSDRLVEAWSPDTQTLLALQTYKGWFYVFLTSVLAFVLWYGTHLRLEKTAVQARNQELMKDVMLQSIGDGVIATDAEQRITLINPEAKRLTGWTAEEALGKKLGEVFRIEDEQGHYPAETPSGAALRTKDRSGLAHFTILVNREGRRMAIADSDAPILDPESGQQQGTILVFRDVSERRRWEDQLVALNEDLREAKNHAEASDRAKSDFLAVMSHEMRTPLNPIMGYACLLADKETDPAYREYLEEITTSANRLLKLIEDVLTYADLDRYSYRLNEERRNLRELLESLESEYAESRNPLRLSWALLDDGEEGTEGNFAVHVDTGVLLRILRCLLDNARKFCDPAEAELVVRRERRKESASSGHWFRFEVTDHGPGIPEEEQQRMFEPFTQLDNSSTRGQGGAGLGLAVSRKMIDLLGGEMGLESGRGSGCRFWFRIPLRPADD